MDIQITGRNIEVTDKVKAYVNDRLDAVLVNYPRVESCHVVLSIEKYRHTANMDVQGRDKLRVDAMETTDDMYTAIDGAIVKLDKQLRKSRQKKLTDHHKDRQRLADMD